MDAPVPLLPEKRRTPRLLACFLVAFPVALGIALFRTHYTVKVVSEFGTGVTILGNAGVYKAVIVRHAGTGMVAIKTPDGELMLLNEITEDVAARYDWQSQDIKEYYARFEREDDSAPPELHWYSWNPVVGPHFQYDGKGKLTEARLAGTVAFSFQGSEFVTLPAEMTHIESIVGSPASRVRSIAAAGAEPP